MPFKLSNLNSNLPLTLGYLNPALNNSVQGFLIREYSSRNPESQLDWQRIHNPVSGIRNPESMAWNPESKTVLDCLTWGGYSSRLRISFPVWCSAAKREKCGEGGEKKGTRKLFLIPSSSPLTFLPSPFRAYLKPRAHTTLPSLLAISSASPYCWFSKHKVSFLTYTTSLPAAMLVPRHAKAQKFKRILWQNEGPFQSENLHIY